MKTEQINQWADALENGDYNKGTGALRKKYPDGTYGYCCLGVLKDIMGCTWKAATNDKFDMTELQEETGSTVYFDAYDDDPSVEVLSESLYTYLTDDDLEQFGLPWAVARDLAEQNDGGDTFEDIAKTIRHVVPVDESA